MAYEFFGADLSNPENWIAVADVFDTMTQLNSEHIQTFHDDEHRLDGFIIDEPELAKEFLTYLTSHDAAHVRLYGARIADRYAETDPDLTVSVMIKTLDDSVLREEYVSSVEYFLTDGHFDREVIALGVPRLHKLIKKYQETMASINSAAEMTTLKLPTDQELGEEIVQGLGFDSLDGVAAVFSMEERGDGYLMDEAKLAQLSQREVQLLIARDTLLNGENVATKLFGVYVEIVPLLSNLPGPSAPDDGGDPSGDREPRVPILPNQAGSAPVPHGNEHLFQTERQTSRD